MLTHLLVLSETGPTSTFYGQGLESTPQLYNENRVLKEENRSLQSQLSHMSRGGWSKATNCGHSRVPLFHGHTNHQLEKQRGEVEITELPRSTPNSRRCSQSRKGYFLRGPNYRPMLWLLGSRVAELEEIHHFRTKPACPYAVISYPTGYH